MHELQDAALAALRDALRSSRIADRLRAAETVLRATRDATGASGGAPGLAELSDQALLEIARGVHPREMGPVTPSAETVPSHAHPDRDSEFGEQGTQKGPAIRGPGGPAAEGTQNGPAIQETPPPGLVTPDNPFMKRVKKAPAPPREPEPWE
jgi:hypothetical protein